MSRQAVGEEAACCPPPPCKHVGLSHHADLGVAQTPLCLPGLLPPLLWVASFLLCRILHTQILAKKKRHSAAEEPFPQVSLRAGPKSS